MGDFLIQFGLLTGLIISFVIFYYFGKLHDGWIFLASLFLINLAVDLIQPPYAVSPQGTIESSYYFSTVAIDYVIGTLFSSVFSGILLFYMTYFVGFIILFVAAMYLGKLSKTRK
jgi:hypothetical protein